MLETLKQAGKNIGRELIHTWEDLSEGWIELLSRSSNALTYFSFSHSKETSVHACSRATYPRWGLLAGEVEELDKEIVVRMEVPGMEKEDFNIMIEGNLLYLSGEKHSQREMRGSTYHMMERAYGSFQRSIPLPANVDSSKAQMNYRNGVLNIRLSKLVNDNGRVIRLSRYVP
jgi:HSP20 family protein